MAMSDRATAGDLTSHEPDTFPVWTVRFIWRVTGADDRPKCTYELAASESEAVDRAVFALDHYQNSAVGVLVCVLVKRPDGWSEVPRSNVRLARHEHLYAGFQQTPGRVS